MEDATTLAGANVLLVGLTYTYYRNDCRFATSVNIGLFGFGPLLLVENLLAFYFSFSVTTLYSAAETVHLVVFSLRGLEFGALSTLTLVTPR